MEGHWLVFFPHCKTKKASFGLNNGNLSNAKRKFKVDFPCQAGFISHLFVFLTFKKP